MKLALLLGVLPTLAFAQAAPQIEVQADVVHAMEKGNTLEPASLSEMQRKVSKKKRYGSLKRLSTQRLLLEAKPQTLSLPNGKRVEMQVDSVKDDVATLRVKVPPGDVTYKLGRTGSFYQEAGAYEGGDLWLVLSPPAAAK